MGMYLTQSLMQWIQHAEPFRAKYMAGEFGAVCAPANKRIEVSKWCSIHILTSSLSGAVGGRSQTAHRSHLSSHVTFASMAQQSNQQGCSNGVWRSPHLWPCKTLGLGYWPPAKATTGRRLSTKTSQLTQHSFGPSQHSLRLLLETSLGKTLTAVGPARAGLLRLPFSKPRYQFPTNPGSAPARATGPLGLRCTRYGFCRKSVSAKPARLWAQLRPVYSS